MRDKIEKTLQKKR